MVLGLVLGAGLLAPLFGVSRLLKANHADIVLYIVMGTVFGGLFVGLGVLMGYRFITPSGFVWFGSATVAGYVVALGVLSVRVCLQLLKD
jgi:voltage-gated potassium channel Kch